MLKLFNNVKGRDCNQLSLSGRLISKKKLCSRTKGSLLSGNIWRRPKSKDPSLQQVQAKWRKLRVKAPAHDQFCHNPKNGLSSQSGSPQFSLISKRFKSRLSWPSLGSGHHKNCGRLLSTTIWCGSLTTSKKRTFRMSTPPSWDNQRKYCLAAFRIH